ncbi:MAG: FAD-dependent monooxygenase [Devosiaceae bacterium]
MQTPVPIVGGGIAGLTTALSLAHKGMASKVYEKVEQLEEVGAGLQLSPNAVFILQALGLGPALKDHAVAPRAISIRDGRKDTPIAQVPLGETAQARYGAPYYVIHRADLQRVLVEACHANDLIDIHLGKTIEPDDGLPLVIAADGVHSAWRAEVRTQSHMHFSGYVAWRTTIARDSVEVDPHTHVWFGPGAHLVDYPISAGRARNMVAIARQDDPRPIRANPNALLAKAFGNWHTDVRNRLTSIDDWTPWPLFGVDPDAAWVNEHVALVGDAAHAMLPFVAQGGAMAIEDAWVLAQMLTSTSQPNQAFARYEKARKLRVKRVWQEAARNGSIYHLTGPAAFARNTVLKARSGENLLARFDWLYGWRPSET